MPSSRTKTVDISHGHLKQHLEQLFEQLGYINAGERLSEVTFGSYAFNPNDIYYADECIPVKFRVGEEVQTIIFNGKN